MRAILNLLSIQVVLSVQFWKHAGIDSTHFLFPELPLQPAVVSESVIELLLPQKPPSYGKHLVRYMHGNRGFPLMPCSKGIPFILERTAGLERFDAPCSLDYILPDRLASSPRDIALEIIGSLQNCVGFVPVRAS